jgi:hypothetical protein
VLVGLNGPKLATSPYRLLAMGPPEPLVSNSSITGFSLVERMRRLTIC